MRWIKTLDARWAQLQAQDLGRRRHVVECAWAPRVRVTSASGVSRELLAFCSNDYLGLASHPELVNALAQGAQQWGVGSGASALVSGHSRAHAILEADLARIVAPHVPEAEVLSLGTGYLANLALISGVASAQSTFFCDRLNHASLVDGGLLARAWTRCQVERYHHVDMTDLRRRLQACRSAERFIVTDSVFSMDGDIAPLDEILQLAHAFDAMVILDDAHGWGVLGTQGGGALAHFGLRSERLILMGTLGKAAGVGGAFIAAHRSIVRYLLHTARPYIYTTAHSPAMAHALSASLRWLRGPEAQARRQHLQQLIQQFRAGIQPLLHDHGWSLLPSSTPIQALVVGSNARALALSQALETQGLWVVAIRPPTVPKDSARLRIVLSAAHTSAHVDQLLAALHTCASSGAEPVS